MKLRFIFGILLGTLVFHVEGAFIDPDIVLQSDFKGWGTSLAWWADVVGGMDQKIFDYVIEELFSPSKLNLNIVRYVIGGTNPTPNCASPDFRPGGASESFRDAANKEYNWTRDGRQRKTLTAAKAKGVNVIEAFSNSPPEWLTESGCSKGNQRNAPLHSNFNPTNADAFADYATTVIKYYHDNLNITFTTYAPFNEPRGVGDIGGWTGGPNSDQEGCNMGKQTMATVVRSVAKAVETKNMDYLKLAVSDETQVNTQVNSYRYFIDDAKLGNLFSKVNVHGYWEDEATSRKDLLSLMTTKVGHELWMDEMGWTGTPKADMTQGLKLANRIVSDLNKLLPSAWVYWQAVEDVGGWGLIEVPFTNTTMEKIVLNSGYYAMKQFSQHIKKGYQLISVSDANSVAAMNVAEKKLVIVTVNPTNESMAHDFDLRLFRTVGTVKVFRTSAVEQYASLSPPNVSATQQVKISSPLESITTLEFSGMELLKLPNLIKNGDFETVNGTVFTSWEVVGNGTGPIREPAWRGNYSGFMKTEINQVKSFRQQVVLSADKSSPCNVYLTARCLSTQLGSKLGVVINGKRGPESDVAPTGMFDSCSLTFTANPADSVVISYENRGTYNDGTAEIDNVMLRMRCGLYEFESESSEKPSAAAVIGATRWLSVVLLLAAVQLRQ